VIGREDGAAPSERTAGSGGSVAEDHSLEGTSLPDSSHGTSAAERQYTPAAVSRKPLGCLIEVAETLILTIVIFWLIQTFVAQPYKVQQQSMEPTLEPDQYVLVDKITPKFDPYSRGDVVVFNPVIHEGDECAAPIEADSLIGLVPYIKRVIGEPGDLVELRDGSVYVNGARLDEPYVHGQETTPQSDQDSWIIQDGRLFVMGDNRNNSTDSRSEQIGEICNSDVIGRAFLRYWPINTLGILQTPTYPNVPPASSEEAPATP